MPVVGDFVRVCAGVGGADYGEVLAGAVKNIAAVPNPAAMCAVAGDHDTIQEAIDDRA